jgi:predicted ATPase
MMLNIDELNIVGREKEIDFLEDIYMESRKCGKYVWIQGASGVGKSTLIKRFLHDKSNVCIGMFDFIQSSAPYSAIINLLSDLCSALKMQKLYVTIGPQYFPILSSLLPELEDVTTKDENFEILGNQKSVDKSKVAVEWGFVSLMRAVDVFFHAAVQMITSCTDLSVIIFLDDLQWADRASLKILISLFVENDAITGLMCIGSYRDNEIDVKSLLWHYKSLIHGTEYECFEMSLDNLTFENVLDLVSNVSQTYNLNSEELGRLIYEITNGNSLFVKRSLQYIIDNKMFHKTKGGTSWELDSLIISTEGNVSDNLTALIRDEISHLPPATSEVLQIASLLGREIDISLLGAILTDFGLDEPNEMLKNMLQYLSSKSLIVIDWERGSFHFLHDRIHQATFDLVKQKKNVQATSLRIGRTILKIEELSQGPKSKFKLLLAIDQLNRGSALIENVQEREDLARLNLTAAQEVLGMSAFNLAQRYLELSLQLLGENSWFENYALTLDIKNLLASVFYGNGLMIQALQIIDEIIAKCVSDEDKRLAQVNRIEIFACTNQLDECLSEGKKMLSILLPSLIPLNAGFAKMACTLLNIKRSLKLMSAEDILTLPECEDKQVQCAMKISKC